MSGKTRNYTEEFKKQIVQIAKSERSSNSVAKEYGISKSSVTKWVRDFRTCLHKICVRIFERNFAEGKAKK